MSNFRISPNLPPETMLWRYMSLDKFIDLLSTGELYFTPVSSYINSDPFEGLLPKVAQDAMAGIFKNSVDDFNETIKPLEEMINASQGPNQENARRDLELLRERISTHLPMMEKTYFAIMKSVTVSCWHKNETESEGMWRLYSDLNKGIAIQTNVARLIEAITADNYIVISEVKYLDYLDPTLTPQDCIVNGNFGPYLKRLSFAHENEVRMTISPPFDHKNIDSHKPSGVRIKIDPLKLIEKIYISPYVSQPFPNAVNSVAEKFGLDKKIIVTSKLLQVDESLLSLY
ncbi:DUF2971 domain-containing protein [Enterobacter vonholyi]|uniref:DUF2971 domain-containing protein n=1 Tax=Enterobacter vonholyi TaxID=2797505 RepID=A0ABU6EA98_9ENTR|nr:DUF2971 domain-containing protein [Enterobacter vonholyi]MEB6412136.1 DUF2971 domain-containing protein [Enterobacter vonholyi]